MEDFFWFTLGSCWADMTYWQVKNDLNGTQRKSNNSSVSAQWRPHHDMQGLVLQPVSSGQGDGVKLCGYVPHEGWFQDVAAFAVNQESALVHIHVCTGSLEV